MGMCADIPVLTLYCSTSYEFGFYPYNRKSSYLSYDDLFCKPCGIHGYDKCPVRTFDCGYLLKPGIVISKIENMLNG
jgi:heptosyltransferase-2